jgi:hypothetical protein
MSALICNCFGCEPVSPGLFLLFCQNRPVQADAGLPAWPSLPTELEYVYHRTPARARSAADCAGQKQKIKLYNLTFSISKFRFDFRITLLRSSLENPLNNLCNKCVYLCSLFYSGFELWKSKMTVRILMGTTKSNGSSCNWHCIRCCNLTM